MVATAHLLGNVVRDPELKTVGNDQKLAKFSVACSRKYKGKESTSFIDCDAWGKAAEIIVQYVNKGDKIYVEGELRQDSWNAPDGEKRSKLFVTVKDFHFLGGKTVGDKAESTAVTKDKGNDDDIPF